MKISFQGIKGAYSNLAAENLFPEAEYVGAETFAQALEMVAGGYTDRAVIPVENSMAGRVADVHFLLPKTGLHIVGEYYFRVRHQLWGIPGSNLHSVAEAFSHPQALAQCSVFLNEKAIKPHAVEDTALACQKVAAMNDKALAAIASETAGKIYGLSKLAADIEDSAKNTTRFLIMSREPETLNENPKQSYKTSLIFRCKNIPSALYMALGCFAEENLNLSKIESYLIDGSFKAAQFYVDVECFAGAKDFQHACHNLLKVCESVHVLGTYPAAAA